MPTGAEDYVSTSRVPVWRHGRLSSMPSVCGVYETLKALRDGTPPGHITHVASNNLMKQVTREAGNTRWVSEFLGA